MDFIEALTLPFGKGKTGGIKRMLTAMLTQFVPIYGQLVLMGWWHTVMERAQHRTQPVELPPVRPFFGLAMRGLRLLIVFTLFQLPLLIWVGFFSLAASFGLPPIIITLINEEVTFDETMASYGAVAGSGLLVLLLLVFAWGIPMLIVFWSSLMRFNETGDFATFFDLSAAARQIKEHRNTFFMMTLFIVLGVVMAFVALSITVIGVLFFIPFLMYYTGSIMGQAARFEDLPPPVSRTQTQNHAVGSTQPYHPQSDAAATQSPTRQVADSDQTPRLESLEPKE
ncbi:MAG: DUF4013 domain-containing protein [Chloroflexi bacterium]|nr:DUF4013 domain-containing protein [Chloroflexota bacterium]